MTAFSVSVRRFLRFFSLFRGFFVMLKISTIRLLIVLIHAAALSLAAIPCVASAVGDGVVQAAAPAEPLFEVWGYLMEGSESAYSGNEPVTDLCYFRSIIDFKGRLIGAVPIPSSVPVPKSVRRHLVVAELSNRTLEHLVLSPDYRFRGQLLDDIAAAAVNFDGVQIDFEAVPDIDKNNYLTFIAEVKKRIGGKTVSVAVPARREKVNDAYDYDALGAAADRVIVMAYDEHWNRSAPGPIASLEWGKKVVLYASSHIPKEKLVMGVPLYGRSWQKKGFSREISYSDAETIIRQSGRPLAAKEGEYPMFEYSKPVKIVLYYENSASIMAKVNLYREYGARCVALWRLGQGPSDMWGALRKECSFSANTAMAAAEPGQVISKESPHDDAATKDN